MSSSRIFRTGKKGDPTKDVPLGTTPRNQSFFSFIDVTKKGFFLEKNYLCILKTFMTENKFFRIKTL